MRLVVVLLAAVLLGSGGVAVAAPARGLDWTPCGDGVECADLTVPIDWNRRAAGTIDVAVARTRATGPRIGTLVYLPGGPGDSGVQRLLDGNVVPPAVAERFDVVSYDPRGTNRSHPVTCDAALLAALPNTVPDAGARLADVREYARDLGRSCREHTGPLLDHVDNVSVARDIDALRAALGERQVTLYGRSYGTLAGQMYAENFPRRVRGLVLDSVFDHSLDVASLLDSQARSAEDSFTEFARWCESSSCGVDPAAAYRKLWDQAVRGESAAQLNQELVGYLYEPDWAGLAKRLRSDVSTQSTTAPFPIAAFCTDHRVRIPSESAWRSLWRRQAVAAPTLRTTFAWSVVSLCSAWPAKVPNPQHWTSVDRHMPPVLVMNARHDPATGYEWALNVHRQVGGALLTYDGWGHGVMDRTDCTRATFVRYVVDRTTPPPGAHCAAAVTPSSP